MQQSWLLAILTYLQISQVAQALPRPQTEGFHSFLLLVDGIELTGAATPVTSANTPVTSANSPTTGANSPVTSADSPATGANSPAAGANTPIASANTPVASASAPVTRPSIPVTTSNTQVTSAHTRVPATQRPTCFNATQTAPDTTGSFHSSLETGGNPPVQPFPTSIPSVTGPTLSPSPGVYNTTHASAKTTIIRTTTVPVTHLVTVVINGANRTLTTTGVVETGIEIPVTAASTVPISPAPTTPAYCANGTMNCGGQNVFLPIGTGPVPANVLSRGDHPVPRLGINQSTPIETNKFYANLFLGTQAQSAFTHPYSVSWSKGAGNAMSWGLAISHVDSNQEVDGPPSTNIPGQPVSYFINPIGIQSLIMSAAELGSSTTMTTDSLKAFSANVNLLPQPSSGLTKRATGQITFPLVQGMGFVTALYTTIQPWIQTSVFFDTVSVATMTRPGIFKYRIILADGKTWLLYATPSDGANPNFQLASNTLLQGPAGWSGTIQIAKSPSTATEAIYDAAAGVYPTSAIVSGSVLGSMGAYSLAWTKGGVSSTNTTLLMYALPHHIQSFDSATRASSTALQLNTTTKGVATAVRADSWTMVESSLPIDMDFAPWSPTAGSVATLSQTATNVIQNVSATEISQNMSAQSDLDSMYYSGKALSKFASLIWTVNNLTNNPALAAAGLANLKSAFSLFVENQQQYPLVYDTAWKGVVSSASYTTGDSGQDFGNSYYNDHHFHFGYFIHAAAVIGALDPSWLPANKDWVNMLVRDVSTPVTDDPYFPFSRSFDWYHGHSWAKGLFESADSKDEESSSEDAMYAYALKMWGKTTGDASMEARGNLMLSIMARSLQNYFLLESNNTNQPANFIGNKVTGILFENKVDHTTYFGANLEYIQGIHMIPLNPFSTLTRTTNFVKEEWNTYFADNAIDPASKVVGGWKGILYANLAIIDPITSWKFFSQENFDPTWLDGGASLTWYLAYAAGLGGAPS